jgi:hypothetical protein
MDAQLEVKLIECLDALAEGESVEQILARYPQDAAQLRPLLQTATRLPALRMEPSEAQKIKSRQTFIAQADLLRRTSKRKTMGFLPRFVTGFVAAGLVAVVLSTGVVAASGSALPGDPLYSVKRTVENVRLSAASSPVQHDELQREFEQRRRDETNELLDTGRESEVEFTGPIESIQPNAWIVGGLAVEVDANTAINRTPQLNRLAEVKGVTGPRGLRASSITIEPTGESDETPEAKGTAIPEVKESTETPEPTETPQPTETETPVRTPQPTRTLRPTEPPRPTATAEPVEVEFTGNVQAIGATTWNIDGTTLGVNANTEVRGSINVGQRVKVKALRQGNGQLIAVSIESIDSGSGRSGGSGSGNTGSGGSDQPVTPEAQPSIEPTKDHSSDHSGSTPEPTEDHSGDHGGSTPEPTKSSSDH